MPIDEIFLAEPRGFCAGVVRECGPDWLLFDFNHPLAGQPVRFEVKLLGVM